MYRSHCAAGVTLNNAGSVCTVVDSSYALFGRKIHQRLGRIARRGRSRLRNLRCVIASWDRWIRHRPALDESLRLDVGSMTPFLSDFLPRSEATKQSILYLRRWIASLRSQ